ncbi:MAG: ribosome-associated translation inhibitor RaiA [Acidobacteriota bacterium]|nr:ribosome-associated translation inhibitor RaiA [Blastocatellia bacterium]MDW8413596.1 ribosome-associated translation inhibitor RaiA [Acidobacteriota bacterium]
MKIEFTGRHVTVTAAIKKHTEEHLKKLQKVLDFDSTAKVQVILEVERQWHNAEIVFSWRDNVFAAKAQTDDMYTAITQAIDKLERQAIKLKGKKTIQKRHSAAKEAQAERQSPMSEEGPVLKEPRIVRSRRYAVKPLTPEEAAAAVSASEDQFLVFRNAETDRIGVIYKRKDGNFGLIEP